MKINTSFNLFKKSFKKKSQVLFVSRKCDHYSKIENLFKFLLAKKNSFILSLLKKAKLEADIL